MLSARDHRDLLAALFAETYITFDHLLDLVPVAPRFYRPNRQAQFLCNCANGEPLLAKDANLNPFFTVHILTLAAHIQRPAVHYGGRKNTDQINLAYSPDTQPTLPQHSMACQPFCAVAMWAKVLPGNADVMRA